MGKVYSFVVLLVCALLIPSFSFGAKILVGEGAKISVYKVVGGTVENSENFPASSVTISPNTEVWFKVIRNVKGKEVKGFTRVKSTACPTTATFDGKYLNTKSVGNEAECNSPVQQSRELSGLPPEKPKATEAVSPVAFAKPDKDDVEFDAEVVPGVGVLANYTDPDRTAEERVKAAEKERERIMASSGRSVAAGKEKTYDTDTYRTPAERRRLASPGPFEALGTILFGSKD